MTRFLRNSLIAATALLVLLLTPNIVVSLTSSGEGRCYGSTSNGRLDDGVRLRGAGAGLGTMDVEPYCHVCVLALRTYVHADVADAVLWAYGDLEYDGRYSSIDWVYGETGWPWGGSFRPHRTHQNGLSVDFMVPLKYGARIPTHPFNLFGYDEEFDANGKGEAGQIDFDAIAAHLHFLEKHAKRRGGIARVILAPDLQDNLFAARPDLRERIRFNTRQAWVRHDDHYHVDFDFPCAPMPSG